MVGDAVAGGGGWLRLRMVEVTGERITVSLPSVLELPFSSVSVCEIFSVI